MADAEGDDKPSAEEQLREKLRDAKVKFLEAVKEPVMQAEAALHGKIADEVLAESPGHLPVLLWRLKRAESAWSAKAKVNTATAMKTGLEPARTQAQYSNLLLFYY